MTILLVRRCIATARPRSCSHAKAAANTVQIVCMKPASEISVLKDTPFGVYDGARVAATAEASSAEDPQSEYVASSVAHHLVQLQLDVLKDTLSSAKDARINGKCSQTDLDEFMEWIEAWPSGVREDADRIANGVNDLVRQYGKEQAEELLHGGVIPRVEAARDEAREAIARSRTEVSLTDRVHLRAIEPSEFPIDEPPAFAAWHLGDDGAEVELVAPFGEQEFADLLLQQGSDPQGVGTSPEGGYYFLFKGRLFWCAEADPGAVSDIAEHLPEDPDFVEQFDVKQGRSSGLALFEQFLADVEDEASFEELLKLLPNVIGTSEAPAEDAQAIEARLIESLDNESLTLEQYAASASALHEARPGEIHRGVGPRQPIPESVRHAVWRRDEGRCRACGSQERLEFDHMVPHSKGGSDTERNLQLLCETCNRRKSATI